MPHSHIYGERVIFLLHSLIDICARLSDFIGLMKLTNILFVIHSIVNII